ncbi:helix-turn-helix transcriptional regulator [Actinomadura barringtoniae]|uniref:Helix-turn-helix transcriptional regulator n=1 Tax=Actinomadura barringtoniae TaxID=1427535 RepID=A0A939T8T9_9ACTN|nr:helix-turn-helix transcriptional regulator [Actinomadura barringtoniae]MBO2454523.1 helix-turn-helix transcriptional regulator [Actinomadura barringtoniae]
MSDLDLMSHLSALGVPPVAARAFQVLLHTNAHSVQELAEHLHCDVEDTRRAIDQLVDLGLAVSHDGGQCAVPPAEPDIALQHLVSARSAELLHAHTAAINAYRDHRRTTGLQRTDDLVEVVTGPQIKERIRQLERSVESQVARFDSPPFHMHGGMQGGMHGGPNPTELDNLERGVEYRVVYASASVSSPDYYALNVQPCISAGEDARVLPTLPVKLTIFDQRVALVSMSAVEVEQNGSLLLVYQSSLLSALLGLFESCWRAAFPMHLGTQAPPVLRPVQRQILELLGTGVPDDTIAQLLKISRRTLSRNLEQLYLLTGAATRFQLALHASRKGWI